MELDKTLKIIIVASVLILTSLIIKIYGIKKNDYDLLIDTCIIDIFNMILIFVGFYFGN